MKKAKWFLVTIVCLVLIVLSACGMKEKSTTMETEEITDKQGKNVENITSVEEQKKDTEDPTTKTEVIQENDPVTSVEEEKQQDGSGKNTPTQEVNQQSELEKPQRNMTEPIVEEEKQPEAHVAAPVYKPVGIPTIQSLLPEGNSEPRTKPITHVVIHFSSNAANNPQEPYNVQAVRGIFSDYGVSAHYLIGRNGDIYELVSENRVAYHAGKGNLPKFPHYKDKLNQYAIGIELLAIGTKQEMSSMVPGNVYDSINPELIGYTNEQYQALHTLLEDILVRIPSITKDRDHIIGHDEYAPGRKTDPGSLFNWSRIGI